MQFDVIFLDPPYHLELVGKSLQKISASGILSTGGLVVAEHDAKEAAPEQADLLVMNRQKRYGTTLLTFYALAT